MTYCLGLNLDAGLVLLADSRTNAGVDNISTFGKLFTWSVPAGAPNARAVALMTAGNLSVTQEVLALIEEEIAAEAPPQPQGQGQGQPQGQPQSQGQPQGQSPNAPNGPDTILSAPSMFRVATRIGALMNAVRNRQLPILQAAGVAPDASIIVAGQLAGDRPRMFLIYPPGNFIEATPDTPFMQIGELKYGKPILDRSVTPATPLNVGVKAALLSMDATLRSNLSVGLPLDLAVADAGALSWRRRRIDETDPIYESIRQHWRDKLNAGLAETPDLPF